MKNILTCEYVLYVHCKYSISSLVQFEQLFDRIKNTYNQKLVIRINCKFPYEKLAFFLGEL